MNLTAHKMQGLDWFFSNFLTCLQLAARDMSPDKEEELICDPFKDENTTSQP